MTGLQQAGFFYPEKCADQFLPARQRTGHKQWQAGLPANY
jgi:hypothetical protein